MAGMVRRYQLTMLAIAAIPALLVIGFLLVVGVYVGTWIWRVLKCLYPNRINH